MIHWAEEPQGRWTPREIMREYNQKREYTAFVSGFWGTDEGYAPSKDVVLNETDRKATDWVALDFGELLVQKKDGGVGIHGSGGFGIKKLYGNL
jgi:hypothetical protein